MLLTSQLQKPKHVRPRSSNHSIGLFSCSGADHASQAFVEACQLTIRHAGLQELNTCPAALQEGCERLSFSSANVEWHHNDRVIYSRIEQRHQLRLTCQDCVPGLIVIAIILVEAYLPRHTHWKGAIAEGKPASQHCSFRCTSRTRPPW